jgi:hypothetical protein
VKPYGVTKHDRGCCPGHDRFPKETYRNRRSKKAQTRDTQIAHQVARARAKREDAATEAARRLDGSVDANLLALGLATDLSDLLKRGVG